jgi:hypothetical protein
MIESWLITMTKSNKQKRQEIKKNRQKKADKIKTNYLPKVLADHEQLRHNNTYDLLPNFYVDKSFICRDCGSSQVWTALQQKWWYEVAKGNINSTAVRCRSCRQKLRLIKENNQAKQLMNKDK